MKHRFFFSLFFILTLSLCAAETTPLQIRIICLNNQAGLGQDYRILEEELTHLGHSVQYGDPKEEPDSSVDINLFIEKISIPYMTHAEKNYFIPNPEWYRENNKILQKCDLVLCRNQLALKTFKKKKCKTYFLNFTSFDRYTAGVEKDYYRPLHTKGVSNLKSTNEVIGAWKIRPDFPVLTFTQIYALFNPQIENIHTITGFIPSEELIEIQNSHGLHICPSQAEGFGHYIIEGMSTGAVVVTTDAPPMNEYITDKRCLVPVHDYFDRGVTRIYKIHSKNLAAVVSKLFLLNEDELRKIGERNRNYYLEQKADFRLRLKALFGDTGQS